MHYYQFNISDFNNATRHLTRVERSLYRDLIDLYYDTELPLPSDIKKLARLVLASTDDEKKALGVVLEEFFLLENGAFFHERCDLEIKKYQGNSAAKSRAGKASAEARRKSKEAQNEQNLTGVEQVLNTCATNQELRTKNYKPRTINQEPLSSKDSAPSALVDNKKSVEKVRKKVDQVDWGEFFTPEEQAEIKQIRKTNKGGAITQRVANTLIKEFELAVGLGWSVDDCLSEWAARGWKSFKSEWLDSKKEISNYERVMAIEF